MTDKHASAPREIELKLELAAADIGKVKRLLSKLAQPHPLTHSLVSVYFDTPRRALRAHRVSLRVRRVDGKYVQTVKNADGLTAGLYDRAEWEHAIPGPQPDLSCARETGLGPLVTTYRLATSLRPVFETRVRRTEFRIARGGAVIAAALDHGTVQAGLRRGTLCELELELVHGPLQALFRLAGAVAAATFIKLSVKTKADRGYELFQGTSGNSRAPTERIQTSANVTAAGAFQAIARGCLRQLLANENTALTGDGEALHRMRVALRRLLVAIGIFSRVVRDRHTAILTSELRRMERELGAARDFDVFFAAVVDRPHEQYRNASVRAMRHALSDRRDAVYARLGQSLQARRCRNLELAVARWVEVGPWITSGNSAAVLRRDRPVSYLAADVLANCRKKVKRRGEHLGRLNPADRHKLRIRVKTLRYAVEFFSEVFPGEKRAKRCREALAALVDLQDSLGALNDLVKRESLSSPQNRVPSSDAATAFELAPRLLAKGGQKTRLLRRAKHAFKSFCAVKPFWK